MLPRDRAMLVSELGRKGFLLAFAPGSFYYGTVVPNPWTTSKLSGVSVPFGLQLFPWKMQVAGPAPTSPHGGKGWPPCSPAPGLQRGRMRLQRIAMVTGTFLIFPVVCNDCSGRCTTEQPSKRRWDFRPHPMSMFPRTGRMESVPQEGVGDPSWRFPSSGLN